MPYIITVLVLVILGTGYTLFQRTPPPALEVLDSPTKAIAVAATTETASPLDVSDESDVKEDDENEDDTEKTSDVDDNPSVSDLREQSTIVESAPLAALPVVDNNTYINGTYYATKSYRTPDGTYQMNVSVTISNDTITGSTLSFDTDGARDSYSKRFLRGYQNQVIGQDMGSVSLSRVGGASLTTNAFNNALLDIKSQAS